MSKCKHEIFSGKCDMMSQDDFHKCVGEDICACYKPMTNADRIRSMTDEELAKYIGCPACVEERNCFHPGPGEYACDVCCTEWLQQPVNGAAE